MIYKTSLKHNTIMLIVRPVDDISSVHNTNMDPRAPITMKYIKNTNQLKTTFFFILLYLWVC